MLMPPFTLHHPTTIDEAVNIASSLINNQEEFDWVAGGTDVLPNYKWRINPKPHVISLAKIPEANEVTICDWLYDKSIVTHRSQRSTPADS